MRHTSGKVLLVKTCAVLAYSALLFEWAIAALPYLLGALGHGMTHPATRELEDPSPVSPMIIQHSLPWWLIALLVGLLVAAAAGVVIASFLRAPKAIGGSGQKVTHAAVRVIIPVVTHHHPLPAKERRRLTSRLTFIIKVVLVIIPFLVIVLVPLPVTQVVVPRNALEYAVGGIAIWALVIFSIQAGLAKFFRIPYDRLW